MFVKENPDRKRELHKASDLIFFYLRDCQHCPLCLFHLSQTKSTFKQIERYLEPSKISKLQLFAKIVNDEKLNFRCLTSF